MAPTVRRGGKAAGPSRIRDGNGAAVGDGDVGMAEASGSGGPDRRRRSGRGVVNSRVSHLRTIFQRSN